MSTAKVGVEVTGARAGVAELEDLKQAVKAVGDAAESVSVKMLAAKKRWSDPLGAKEWSRNTKLAAEGAKLLGSVIAGQATSIASAVTSPAKTTYDEALRKAYTWRDENQRVALSLGKSYGETQKQIFGTAQSLGMLPSRVRDYAGSVRQLTGDWQGAIGGLEGYQNRALKTDRTIEEMIPTAAALAQTFGVKSTEDVNKFFGTLDAQARKAGVSAEITEKAFASMAGMLSSMTSAKPSELTGITAGFLKGAPTPELGQAAMGEVLGLISAHPDQVENWMRKSGKLGKGERLRDKSGRVRGEKLIDAMEVLQTAIPKWYQTKDKDEAVARIARTGEMSATGAAALFNLDIKSMREGVATTGTAAPTSKEFLATAAGARQVSEARKDIKDTLFGESFLGAQDKAVSMGGGAAGIAIGSAGDVFNKAASTFWNAVEIFAAAAGGKAVGAAAGAGVSGAGIGSKVAGVAGRGAGLLGKAASLAGRLALPLQIAETLTMSGTEPERYRQPGGGESTADALQERLKMERAHLAEVKKGGIGGWAAETFFGGGETETKQRIAELEAEISKAGKGDNLMSTADAIGKSTAEHLAKKTLRTADATAAQPPGQSQSL